MDAESQLESILFVASKPLSEKKLAKVLKISAEETAAALKKLKERYNNPDSGINLIQNQSEWQLASNPKNRAATEQFVKSEISGELTRPQLETLTVLSYCGPLTKPELEQIRGVNSSLILRNLIMRGLIKEVAEPAALLPQYEVTMDYVRALGIISLDQLPDYQELHNHQYLNLARSESGAAPK